MLFHINYAYSNRFNTALLLFVGYVLFMRVLFLGFVTLLLNEVGIKDGLITMFQIILLSQIG